MKVVQTIRSAGGLWSDGKDTHEIVFYTGEFLAEAIAAAANAAISYSNEASRYDVMQVRIDF